MTFAGGVAHTSVYGAWVAGLRTWSRNPATGLGPLPELTVETFDQNTFGRLIAHVHTAIGEVMNAWSDDFQRAMMRAGTTHELATELIRLRRLLEPRVDLATRPEWPAEVRDALWGALVTDVERMQNDLEAMLARSTSRGGYDRAFNDKLVDVARKNPLTAVLSPQISSSAATVSPLVAAPPRDEREQDAESTGVLKRVPRRILTDAPSIPTD